jgi:hypothetical protein
LFLLHNVEKVRMRFPLPYPFSALQSLRCGKFHGSLPWLPARRPNQWFGFFRLAPEGEGSKNLIR